MCVRAEVKPDESAGVRELKRARLLLLHVHPQPLMHTVNMQSVSGFPKL